MTILIKENRQKLLKAIPIFLVLFGCCRVAFVFNYGYPLRMQDTDFTVEDPTDQVEITFTFVESIAFHRIEGIEPYVIDSKKKRLNALLDQIEPATYWCRNPFDSVLLGPGAFYGKDLEQKVTIQYTCPSKNSIFNYRTYSISATVIFEKEENGNLKIIRWCDLRQWPGKQISPECS